MSRASSHRPVLLIHPERAEAAYLRDRLIEEGVTHPIVISPSVEDAHDYLLAATIAEPLDPRYLPCLAFVDEKLGEAEVRELTRWVHGQPALGSLQMVRLSVDKDAGGAGSDTWGTDAVIGTIDRMRTLRTMIARECREP